MKFHLDFPVVSARHSVNMSAKGDHRGQSSGLFYKIILDLPTLRAYVSSPNQLKRDYESSQVATRSLAWDFLFT